MAACNLCANAAGRLRDVAVKVEHREFEAKPLPPVIS